MSAESIVDFDIKYMANLIGKPLSDGRFNYYRDHCQPTSKHAYYPVEKSPVQMGALYIRSRI